MAQQVFDSGAVPPEGVVSAEGPAICFDDNKRLYRKKDDGAESTTGWEAFTIPPQRSE